MKETRKMFLMLVVAGVVGWSPAAALGQLQVGILSEDFTTDPGWLEKNSTTNFPDLLNNEFGFRNSDLTRDMDSPNTTGAGEAGGQITRHVEAYYAADIGQIDPKTTKLMASGWLRIPGTGGGGIKLGFFNRQPFDGADLVPTNFIGLDFDAARVQTRFCNDIGNCERSGTYAVVPNPVSNPNEPLPWSIVYDPDGNFGGGTITVDLVNTATGGLDFPTPLGAFSHTFNLPGNVKYDNTFVDSFGMTPSVVQGVENQQLFFIDDIQYTALVPKVGLDGDFNENDTVDAADYTTWQDSQGSMTALPNSGGLAAPIGQAHYNLWSSNFGSSGGSGTNAAVPEPSSLVTYLVGLVAMVMLGRGRPR